MRTTLSHSSCIFHIDHMHVTHVTHVTCITHPSHACHTRHTCHTCITPPSHTQSRACHMNHMYTPYTVLYLSVHQWPLLCCGVQREARAHFGCPTLPGLEIENQGGTGTAGSHWEKRITEVCVLCVLVCVCVCVCVCMCVCVSLSCVACPTE